MTDPHAHVTGVTPGASPRSGSLTDAQRQLLHRMVANEADMSFKRRAEAVYDFLAIAPGERVLDMGCGRGFYLNFTRRLHPRADVVGVELDRPLLDVARRQVSGARLVNGTVYDLPFPDGHFDKVVFSEVIEHVPDDRRALLELHRVLAPGGVLAVTTPNANYPFAWDPLNKTLEALGRNPVREGVLAGIWANHVRLYSPEALARLAAETGFRVTDVRTLTHYCFPFIHNLVYGCGKELMIRGALPAGVHAAADRFNVEPEHTPLLNPVRLGLAVFNAVDRLNDIDPPTADRTFLIIAMRLVKAETGR